MTATPRTSLLVTGGAGFIGSHFVRSWLATHPADTVVTFDLLTYAGSRDRLAALKADTRHRFIQGDICDAAAVRRAISGCRLVVHCAAETHVDRSITDAAPFLRTNVEGTYTLLQEARTAGVSRFLHVSTDEVYGPVERGAVDEQAPLSPRSPYAASKAAGDLLAQSFRDTFGFPVIVARPTNIYGPGQFPEKFIPLCITNACAGVPVPIYGDGQQRRAWLFVDDACDALRILVERGTAGEVYNVASGDERANLDTAAMVLAKLGRPQELLQRVADRPGHDRRYAMDDAKLRALGWQPQTPFAQGLEATIDWYRANEAWWKPLTQTLREDAYHWLNRTPGPLAHPAPRRVG
ncbi:MAG: dTDP-glucose 4,6-dehydratase [Omnitrophica WOR_2 bacterium RIFCSPHIGHO2_02_FULL_67_20]|nr:MAG: dTDP-glucose 4,6-dehydratase [Omnitrophica WOR_2 bacterium RIFCSPHIGHO2_02_FULL_67_20]